MSFELGGNVLFIVFDDVDLDFVFMYFVGVKFKVSG